MLLKLVRAHVIISGDVQGINFRYYTRQKATSLGLRGWVRNLPTGDVEAVFEGEEDKVKEILQWCKKGPTFARVEGVKIDYSNYTGEFDSFERR